MSINLTSAFLSNARGLQLSDGGGVTWSMDPNTNAITATIDGSPTWPINTGWGTPTGGSVANNFSGSAATLPQTSAALAEIIAVLLSAGIIGA